MQSNHHVRQPSRKATVTQSNRHMQASTTNLNGGSDCGLRRVTLLPKLQVDSLRGRGGEHVNEQRDARAILLLSMCTKEAAAHTHTLVADQEDGWRRQGEVVDVWGRGRERERGVGVRDLRWKAVARSNVVPNKHEQQNTPTSPTSSRAAGSTLASSLPFPSPAASPSAAGTGATSLSSLSSTCFWGEGGGG